MAVENIDLHTRTKVKSPQTNGIVERFHRTVLNEFYWVAFRRKIYSGIEEFQCDLDAWLREYNALRSHQGRGVMARLPANVRRQCAVGPGGAAWPCLRRGPSSGRGLGLMNDCLAQQSPVRRHNQPSRSDCCSHGRSQPTRIAREPLRMSRSAGHCRARYLTLYSNRTPRTRRLSEEV